MLIVDSSSANPYKNSKEYQKKQQRKILGIWGRKYHKKITYEKKLNMLYRIGIGALALLATLTIIPRCCNSQRVAMWKQQVNSGVDRKIVLIKEKTPEQHVKSGRQVKFGKTRGRLFDKERAPDEIRNIQSIDLEDRGQKHEKNSVAPQVRKIPPIGMCDTIILSKEGFKSAHGSGELFSDSEIKEKLDIIKRVKIGSNIYAAYSKHGKAIIQQQATRGCTAATAAMLIMDNGKKPNLNHLKSRNLGNDEDQVRDIQDVGLIAVINSANNLLELRKLIIKNGSSIVSVNERLGSHVIIVDEVSEDLSRVRLRDPYHGWEITVTSGAFLKEWHGGKAIQIKKN